MRNYFKIAVSLVLAFVSGMAFFGCGSADQSHVSNVPLKLIDKPEEGIETPKPFEPQDMTLTTNVAFLWKKDVDRQQVDQMTQFGTQLGGIKYLLTKKAFLEGAQAKLKGGIGQIEQGEKQIAGGLHQIVEGMHQLRQGIEAANQEKADEENKIKSDPTHSDNRLKELEAALTQYGQQLAGAEAKQKELLAQQDGLKNQKDGLQKQLAQVEGGLQLVGGKLTGATQGRDPGVILQALRSIEIPKYSDQFMTPEVIAIRFPSTGMEISIQGWDLLDGRGPQNFSTTDGAVSNAKYEVLGGKVSFDVDTRDGYSYSFTFGRNKYKEWRESKLISFHGSLTRKGPNGEKRQGTAKMLGDG